MHSPDNDNSSEVPDVAGPEKQLPPAAKRALEEAQKRHNARVQAEVPIEVGGRGGADPARFGDWEINGRAIDF